jgi:hypothetical protein
VLNTLIAGNPLQSPRILGGRGSGLETGFGPPGDGTGGSSPEATPPAETEDPAEDSPAGTDSDSNPLVVLVGAVVGFLGSLLGFLGDWLGRSLAVLGQPERLYHIFIRSGQIPQDVYNVRPGVNDYEAIELTLLESFPLAAALIWLPVTALHGVRRRVLDAGLTTPRRQTDLLAGGFAVVFTFVYLSQLPLHSQITVRYILPVMPLLVYGVARCGPVRHALQETPRWVVGGYLTTVVVGGIAVTGALLALDPAIGEAMQFHALAGLGTAAVATVAVVLWPLYEDTRVLAVALALPAGTTTVFLLLAQIEYFAYRLPGDDSPQAFVLDSVRVIADLLPLFH